jgi:2-hydroxy-4-(methylsulfanyl)butanoate S-methyltransferase
MDLLKDVRDVSRIGYGFMGSKALFAAVELDLFTRLAERPRTVGELAEAAGVGERPMRMLLAPLRALGLVGVDDDGRYLNSPAAATYLSKASPHYYGDYFRFQIDRQVYPAWTNLLAALRGDPVPRFYDQMQDAADARDFSVAQHAGSLGPAHLLARRLDASGWRRLLDVAGGTGAFSITLCRRNPGLAATIIDFPNVCALAAGYIAEEGLGERIGLLPGDARQTDWPGGQDAVLMSYLLSTVPESDIRRLVGRAFDSLAPGGVLVLHDFMLTDDLAGPLSASLWTLGNLVIDPGAMPLSPGWLAEVAGDAGFVDVADFELLPGITRALVARRPPRA